VGNVKRGGGISSIVVRELAEGMTLLASSQAVANE
jgi:hypothetical protein